MLSQYCFNAKPASATLAQQYNNIGWKSWQVVWLQGRKQGDLKIYEELPQCWDNVGQQSMTLSQQ